MEETVTLTSGDRELFAILHRPERSTRRAGLVIVDSRVEYRVGPHRFSVNGARAWADLGFPVLRVDFPGNGDSPGEETYPHMDSFPVPPAVDAVRFFRERAGVQEVILLGQCMGARNALFAAAQDSSVRHLIAIGMPFSNATPFIAKNESMPTQTVSPTAARSALSSYAGRLFRWSSWKTFLSGGSDYGVALRMLPAALGLGQKQVFREPVFRSLRAFLERGGEALFVFGTNDVFLPDFRDQFALVGSRLPGVERCKIEFVEGANHTFSRLTWQRDAIEGIARWLEKSFPTGRGDDG